MISLRSIRVPALLGLLLLAGCYPERPSYTDEYDLVLTNFSPGFDFNARTTYSLPDSVVKINGNLTEGEAPEKVIPAYGDEIINAIRRNMNERGWTEVPTGNVADVVLLPSVFTSTTVNYYYGTGYWDWYYSYGWGGWYYPGYYPTYATSYTSGTLLVQMVDPSDLGATGNVPVVWTGAFNGLVEGSASDLQNRINNGIDQAFTQSDYLTHRTQ